MGALLSGGRRQSNAKPDYTGLQVQTAVATLPIPISWGITKIAPNLIWYADFKAHAQQQQAGKGGGGSISSYTYSASMLMALCEGPIAGIARIWRGKDVFTLAGVSIGSLPAAIQSYIAAMAAAGAIVGGKLPFSLLTGTTPQTAWSYLTSAHSAQALGYSGTAMLAVANYDLGGSPSVDNHNFEVMGKLWGTGVNGLDADPAQVIQDAFSNPQYATVLPSGTLDLGSLLTPSGSTGDASLQSYCKALGICFSPVLNSQETAVSVLQRWMKLLNCAIVWSGTSLKFIPFGDTAVSAHGANYQPNVTPIYDLTDDDFVGDGSTDPIQISRSDVADAKNVIRVEISDRANGYNLVPVEARDETHVNLYGLRVDSGISAHEICDQGVAAIVAQLMLQRGLYVRRSYQFKLSWEYCLLEPMDLVTLTDPLLGLNRTPVRIMAIEEDEQGMLSVTAEEFPAGIAHATLYAKQGSSPAMLNYDAPAASVNTPVIFEPESSLTGGDAEIWIGVSGGAGGVADPLWGGCNVWLSTDGGTSYPKMIGTIDGAARQGVLTAGLAAFAGSNPDTTGTVGVNLSLSAGSLMDATSADGAAGRTLFLAGAEIMAYSRATLTSANHYNLTGLYRGLYGTTPGAHSSAEPFLRLDDLVFKYKLPAGYVGATLYLKFQSFNIWGGGIQDLSTCTAYSYGPNGLGFQTPAPAGALTISATIPTPPSGVIAAGGQNVIVVNWAANPEAGVLGYLVWSAEGHDSNFADAAIVAQVSALSFTHANLGYGETRTYWVEAYSIAGSSSPTGPVYATTAYTIPIEAIGEGAISTDKLIPILQVQIASLDAVSQQAIISAAQSGLASSFVAVEQITRASADQALANMITEVSSSFGSTIATFESNVSTLASAVSANASAVTTLSTTLAGNTAAVSAAQTSIDGLQARYTVQVEIDTGGQHYIGGFGVAGGPDGSGGIAFNATFLVNSFTIAQLNGDGSISTVSPFYVSGGNVYIQNALVGSLSANKITSGTISTANIIIQPTGAGQGLTVYNQAGTKVIDSVTGLWPGNATFVTPNTTVISSGTMSSQPIIGQLAASFSGRAALMLLSATIATETYSGGSTVVYFEAFVDGALVSGGSNNIGNSGGANAFLIPFNGSELTSGSHTITITANGGGTGSRPTVTAINMTIVDFKA